MEINRDFDLSHNSWAGNDPRSILLHTTLGGGNITGVIDTLEARGLSYNYVIKNGIVYELVPYTRCAWHSGVVSGMNLRALAFYKDGKGPNNPNRHSVGIAFDYSQGEFQLLEKDIDAAILLIKWLGQETGHRYNADNIFFHREVTSYKPLEVKHYRDQVLEALVGNKDDKDQGETAKAELLRRVLIEIIKRYTRM